MPGMVPAVMPAVVAVVSSSVMLAVSSRVAACPVATLDILAVLMSLIPLLMNIVTPMRKSLGPYSGGPQCRHQESADDPLGHASHVCFLLGWMAVLPTRRGTAPLFLSMVSGSTRVAWVVLLLLKQTLCHITCGSCLRQDGTILLCQHFVF